MVLYIDDSEPSSSKRTTVLSYLQEKARGEERQKQAEMELKREELALRREQFDLEKEERKQRLEEERQQRAMFMELMNKCLNK